MEKLTITEFNAETGLETVRDMTAKEAKEFTEFQARASQEAAEFRAAEQAKEATKAALLERLGITADEAKLLLS